MAVIDLKNCTFELRDGSTHKLVVRIGEGSLTWEEKRNVQYILNRGRLDNTRLGDEVPLEVKFEFEYEVITGTGFDSTFAVEDALKKRGGASAWVSATTDACQPYSVDIYMFNIQPCNTLTDETIILPEYRYESLNHDPKAGNVTTSGKCNVVEATATRGAAAAST